jgi:hypothetical protein
MEDYYYFVDLFSSEQCNSRVEYMYTSREFIKSLPMRMQSKHLHMYFRTKWASRTT